MTNAGIVMEREVKLRLSGRDDYERFAGVLPVPRRWGLQLNVYLDASDRILREVKVSLRVRITPDHARLTMKTPWGLAPPGGDGPIVTGRAYPEMAPGQGPGRDGRWDRDSSGAFVHSETEIEIPRDTAVRWAEEPASATPWDFDGFQGLSGILSNRPLAVSCWSLTRRAICDMPEGVTVELDETVFSDGFRDFEVEIEHPDSEHALTVARDYAARAGVVVTTQEYSKHARARRHRGDLDRVIPVGVSTDSLLPYFLEPAPEHLFARFGVPGAARGRSTDGH